MGLFDEYFSDIVDEFKGLRDDVVSEFGGLKKDVERSVKGVKAGVGDKVDGVKGRVRQGVGIDGFSRPPQDAMMRRAQSQPKAGRSIPIEDSNQSRD